MAYVPDTDIDVCDLVLYASYNGEKFEKIGVIKQSVPIQKIGLTDIQGILHMTYFLDKINLKVVKLIIDLSKKTIEVSEIATVTQTKYTASVTYT